MVEEVREPQAGIWGFYPISKERLLREIERMFKDSVYGPGGVPQKGVDVSLEVVAGIVPHAGYTYSGPCACWFYKKLAESMPEIDVAVILGTNHTGFGGDIATTTYFTQWSTPLGNVDVDLEFISELKKIYNTIDDDVLAHMREHSVEVQLPFLQYIYNKFKLVPIVVKDINYETAREFAKALYEVATRNRKRCIVIASSDFTHHGPMYNYVIFRSNISENVRSLDMMFIEKILQLDTAGFLNLVHRYNATICGYGAISIVMEYAKLTQCNTKLLKYYHSGDITGDEDIIVGYASVIFYRMGV